MKPRFAWTLAKADVRALGAVRRWSGVEALELPSLVWLRAPSLEDEQWERVRHLPGADLFTVLDDGQLVPFDALVPRGYLPVGDWQPLDRWLSVELPHAGETTTLTQTTTLKLVRSTTERDATWLQTSTTDWAAYAVAAPQVRLARWSFLADRRGCIVVRGTPLPPLPGLRFVEQSGIAVPLGWTWSPNLPVDVVREAFGLAANESLLWMPDGACERIAADDWVQATRSAVRLTTAAT
jgi:hypothetical protein